MNNEAVQTIVFREQSSITLAHDDHHVPSEQQQLVKQSRLQQLQCLLTTTLDDIRNELALFQMYNNAFLFECVCEKMITEKMHLFYNDQPEVVHK